MPLSPGTRLGVYEVSAKIGEGGMGEVYQAVAPKITAFTAASPAAWPAPRP